MRYTDRDMLQEISSDDAGSSAGSFSAFTLQATQQQRMKPCSRISGRERWHVKLLEDRPRLAAAVELVLQTEPGMLEARVNSVTGRVLVCYDPVTLTGPIETLLARALEAGPLTQEEFSLLRAKPQPIVLSNRLIAMEVACGLSHVVLMGGFCPLGLVSAAALFLVKRHCSRRRLAAPLGYTESAATN